MSKYPGRIVTDLAPAGYSVYFNGANSDALEVPNNAAFDFGTGDVTIEAWFYLASTSTVQNLIECAPSGGSGFTSWNVDITTSGFMRMNSYVAGNYQAFEASNNALLPNRWYHFAYTRSSGTNRLFVNGALCTAGGTFTQAINSGGNTVTIGRGKYAGFTRPSTGNFSNVRIVKGVALYTAAFNAPTQLFNVAGTSLLTCNSPAFVDQSSNAFPITALATPSISTFTPFTAYVPYNPALGASTPGVWTVDEAMQAAATRQWNMYDPYFNLTTLLLHGNQPADVTDTNNNVFKDSSSNNFSITRSGNTTQGSYSPFSQTGWGLLTNDRNFLTIPASSDFDLISTDFTVEFWVNVNAFNTMASSGSNFFGNGLAAAVNGWSMGFAGSGNTVTSIEYRIFSGGSQAANNFTGLSFNFGTWNHIVLQRNGSGSGNLRMFVNGVQQGAAQTAVTYSSAGGTFSLGSGSYLQNPTYSGNADYYISNVRLTKAAVYSTSGFTSPTSNLSQISGTTLLICQSNRLINNGTNTGAITSTGWNTTVPQVVTFSPFLPTVAYTPQTIGGSGYFDGTGDMLSVAGTLNLSPAGNVDFSMEAWVYRTVAGVGQVIFNKSGISGTSFPTIQMGIGSGNNITMYLGNSGSPGSGIGLFFNGSSTNILPAGTWNHLAVTKKYVGGAFVNEYRMFVNGKLDYYFTQNNPTDARNDAFTIGMEPGSTSTFTGYIAGARVVKNSIPTAYQTASTTINAQIFTPPTLPLPAVTDTQLLCNFTNAGVVDSTGDNLLETVSTAQISTAQSRFGGSSIFFNGTSDKLVTTRSPLFNFGSSDFTVEGWLYTGSSATMLPLYSMLNGAKTDTFALQISSGGILVAYASALGGGTWSLLNGSTIGTLTLNAWNHFALVRNGSTWNGYVNGVRGSGFPVTSSSAIAAVDGFTIGEAAGAGFWYSGYIDELRFTRFARYTAAFTPQTSQWQDQ